MAETKRRCSFQELKKAPSPRTGKPKGEKTLHRPSSVPQKNPPQLDLLGKEEEYMRLNAELEAKTAELVRQAEEVMREQNEVLSKPISSRLVDFDLDEDENEDFSTRPVTPPAKKPTAKGVTKKKVSAKATFQNRPSSGNKTKKVSKMANACIGDDVAVPEDFSLAKTIRSIEGKLENEDAANETTADDVIPSVGEEMGSEAQIRFLKAKLRVMQEELNRVSCECDKKDDENISLIKKCKELEEDHTRQQRMTNLQQAQIEKHRSLAEESNRKCEGLLQQVVALKKDIEGMKRAQKQAATSHSATEVRLNRALEEAERAKIQLNKLKQSYKDSASHEHQKIEIIQAENKKLEKQKAELISGFKKQLKLIDILKRQKMHFEAARVLSFTEEEFMKALDWGKS